MAQCLLWNVLIVEINIADNGLFKGLCRVKRVWLPVHQRCARSQAVDLIRSGSRIVSLS